jgi:hypothetical protein
MSKSKQIKRAISIGNGDSLASIIEQLAEMGVTDFSKVSFGADSVGCQCDHGDSYCYCESSYSELRFEFMTNKTDK